MKIIEVSACKGGVGTTNVVCSLAITASATRSVLIVDMADSPDVTAWLGMPDMNGQLVDGYNDNMKIYRPSSGRNFDSTVKIPAGDWELIIIDAGTTGQKNYSINGIVFPDAVERVVAISNDYVSLKNTISRIKPQTDRIICLFENGRPLTFKDIENVTGKKCTKVDRDPAVGRAIDAGLISHRTALYEEWANDFLGASVK